MSKKKLSEATDAEIREEMERRAEQRRVSQNESIVAANAKVLEILRPLGETGLLKAISTRALDTSIHRDSLYHGDDSYLVQCLMGGVFTHMPKEGRTPSLSLTLIVVE